MKLLVNAAQMKAADQYTIQELGIASLELMERAANACVQTMQSENLDLSSVWYVDQGIMAEMDLPSPGS